MSFEPLNLLNSDSVREEEYPDDLALWANTEFIFDTTPGTALVEESMKEGLMQTLMHPYAMPLVDYYNIPDPHTTLTRIAPAPGPLSTKRPIEVEDDLAAEDDKRRRNTAASARFRMKKKQREQALERKTKEMADNVHSLESKVKELEMEAQWLRALVLEKDPTLLSSIPSH